MCPNIWENPPQLSSASIRCKAGYDRLAKLLAFFNGWSITRFDGRAAAVFDNLRKQKVRIGSQDLKIASWMRV
jgi:hypothetical protein